MIYFESSTNAVKAQKILYITLRATNVHVNKNIHASCTNYRFSLIVRSEIIKSRYPSSKELSVTTVNRNKLERLYGSTKF